MDCKRMVRAWGLTLAVMAGAAPVARAGAKGVTPEAVEIELNTAGLAAVADYVHDEMLDDLDGHLLPDLESEVAIGIVARIEGAKVWATFEKLWLTPTPEGLRAAVRLRDVRIEIPRLRIWRRVLGVIVDSTCENTEFKVGTVSPVSAGTTLAIGVVDRNITLQTSDVSVPVAGGNYTAVGPATCSSALGLGPLMRSILQGVFANLRPFLSTIIADRLKAMGPTLEEEVNARVHPVMNVDIPALAGLPAKTAELSAFPTAVRSGQQSLVVTLGAGIRKVDGDKPGVRTADLPAEGAERLGRLGLNPAVLTDAFAELYPNGTDWIPLAEGLSADVDAILNVVSAASIWPDLLTAPVTDQHLKAQLKIVAPPRLLADEQSQALRAEVPEVLVRFQAQMNGEWIDYFELKLSLATAVQARMRGEILDLSLLPGTNLTVDGHWGAGYQPGVDLFERDVAEALLGVALDYLQSAGPVFSTWVPTIPVGGQVLGVANPGVWGAYVGLDVVGL